MTLDGEFPLEDPQRVGAPCIEGRNGLVPPQDHSKGKEGACNSE